jgi:hypothetical protein
MVVKMTPLGDARGPDLVYNFFRRATGPPGSRETDMRNASTTPTHDARHCGHVARSESAAVKRARILFECEATVPDFTVPADEPAAVMALLVAMRAGVACDQVARLVATTEWYGMAAEWAEIHDELWFVGPDAGLASLLPA